MALSTRDRLRLMADDQPVYFQDKASGDGAGSVFFLSHFPLYPNAGTAGTVAVSGTALGTASYNLSWQHGRIAFGTAPGSASNNVQVDYLATTLTDDEVDDAYTYAGGSANLEQAAAELWRIKAGRHAAHYSFRDSSQQFDRSDWHKACLAMAKEYEAKSLKTAKLGGAWVAGISIDEKDSVVDDSDRVSNRFRRDQFRNPGTSESLENLEAE